MSKLKVKFVKKHPLGIGDLYTIGKTGITIIHSINNGKNHISLSYKNKLPSYEEMKAARYQICPHVKYMAQIFPPKEEFVNIHNYCLQLWEIV